MALVVDPPVLQSRDFLMTTGRALMRWWNNQGAALPGPGEAYRAWWQSEFSKLDSDFFTPMDVYPQLQQYAQEAREWWESSGTRGAPPPVLLDPDVGVSSGVSGLVLGVLLSAGLIAGGIYLLRGR